MHEHVVLRVVVRMLLPFIVMYALYIQFHGEISPGGGFQSGVILAAGFIVYSFVHDLESVQRLIPEFIVQILSSFGVLLYAGVGLASIIMGGKFLDYSVFLADKVEGQKFGVMLVELGVGITVFSVIMMVFYSFAQRSDDAS